MKAKFKGEIGGWIDDRQSYKGLKTFHGFLQEDFCVFMHTNTNSYIYIYIHTCMYIFCFNILNSFVSVFISVIPNAAIKTFTNLCISKGSLLWYA